MSTLLWNYQAYVYYTLWEFGGISRTRPPAGNFLFSDHTSPWLWMDSVRRRTPCWTLVEFQGQTTAAAAHSQRRFIVVVKSSKKAISSGVHTHWSRRKMSNLQAKPNPSLPSFIASKSFFCISLNDEYEGKLSWLKLQRRNKKHSVENCFEGCQFLQCSVSQQKCLYLILLPQESCEIRLSNDIDVQRSV